MIISGAADSMRIADVALAYERALLELNDISDERKTSALEVVAKGIVPLVGHLAFRELSPELQSGVGQVLASEFGDSPVWVVHVWNDLVRWGRYHNARQANRGF